MRKTIIVLILICTSSINYAQKKIESQDFILNHSVKAKEKSILNQKFDITTLNRSKPIDEAFTLESDYLDDSVFPSRVNDKSSISPFASIKTKEWAVAKNVISEEFVFFETDYKFGKNAYLNVKTYLDDLSVEKQFSINIPESTNSISVMNDFSFRDHFGNKQLIMPIYLHYFEGGTGPNFQKHAIWLVNEDGEILHKAAGKVAFIKKDDQGRSFYYIMNDDEDRVVFSMLNLSTFDVVNTFSFSTDLAYNYHGSPIVFKTIEDKRSIILIHYREKFMDHETFEYTRNNHLVFNALDYNLMPIKQIQVPNLGFDEADPYTMPMTTFGMFYQTDKYDISKNIFNKDNTYEILYGTYFYNMIEDKEWYNYYVVNENGSILKKIEDEIVYPGLEMQIQMKEIKNHPDQVVMLVGEGEAVRNLKVFDIPSFALVYDFPARYNDEMLSFNFNRIPVGDSYNFVIGLSDIEQNGNQRFGIVNYYNSKGGLNLKRRLPIFSNARSFVPFLTPSTLDPYLVNSDDDIEFIYMDTAVDSTTTESVNTFRIAKDENNVLASFAGNNMKGNISTAGYLVNRAGEIDRLFMFYGSQYSNTGYLTEFYKLPLKSLSLNESIQTKQAIIYLQNQRLISFQLDYDIYAIYSIDGRLLRKGRFLNNLSTSGWKKGVYFVKTIDKRGGIHSVKIRVN